MKLLKSEEEAKEDKLAIELVIEAKETTHYGRDRVAVTIIKQQPIFQFEETFFIQDWKVDISSMSHAEFCQGESRKYIKLYLKGSNDKNETPTIFISKEYYPILQEALEEFGATINGVNKKHQNEVKEEKIEGINYDTSPLTPTDEEIKQMIDLVDLDTFNKIIKNRLICDLPENKRSLLGDITREWARNYLVEWAKSKFRFFKILGNQLSISKNVTTELESNDAESMVRELIEEFPLYSPILKSISYNAYANNKISDGNIDSNFYKCKDVKQGMTLTKLISLFNNKELDTAISKLYQDAGNNTIYISINPIDYLTVSINNSGWKSCHHFIQGAYRNAGLSYMLDSVSMIAYASRKDVEYSGRFPYKWNTKNWRQMIYMSKNTSAIIFSRQYPNESQIMSKYIRELLEEKISNYFNSENKWKVFSHVNKANIGFGSSEFCLAYNDVCSGFPHVVVKAKDDIKFDEYQEIEIGGKVRYLLSKRKIVRDSQVPLIDKVNEYGEDE